MDFKSNNKSKLEVSDYCLMVLNDDRTKFSNTSKAIPMSTFINNLIVNYLESLLEQFGVVNNTFNNEIDKSFDTFFFNSRHDSIKKEAVSVTKSLFHAYNYKKIESFLQMTQSSRILFRLNYSSESTINRLFKKYVLPFETNEMIIILVESYSKLPTHKREQIYFLNIYQNLLEGIYSKRRLNVHFLEENVLRKVYFYPHGIFQDTYHTHNILVGKIKSNNLGNELESFPVMIPIKTIFKSSVINSKSGKLTKLEEKIIVQYIVDYNLKNN